MTAPTPMRGRELRRWLLLGALGASLAGCGGSAAMRAAEAGDYDALGASLKGDAVELGEARDIARRVLDTQIATAQGESGRRGLEALGGAECARRVSDALDRRSRHDDELAALAARMRVDAGLVPPLSYAHRLDDPAPHWRAAAARSMTLPAPAAADGPRHRDDRLRAGVWRRQLMLDPSGEVRVAALRAAVDAADPDDAEAVVEAARLDPLPEARLMAIQAAGAIGTQGLVVALKDLWARSDEEARLAIVGAWAMTTRKAYEPAPGCLPDQVHPRCTALGQLQRISDEGDGMPSLIAALELVHDTAPSKAGTPEGNAAAVVERMIDGGSSPVRVEAILSAPLSWASLVEAIVDASDDHDERVSAAAYRRMVALGGKDRDKAVSALGELAKGKGLGADAAKEALVEAADASVAPLLSHDVAAASAEQRATAAVRYAKLGRVSEAVSLVADRDVAVRARAACAVLGMED